LAKFIFVTGGVVSSLGKGIAAASLGALLQARGSTVRLRKLDPYLNVDPGTMSPFQHGEVYVTEDGTETDLDLGHYERFTGVSARRTDSTTTGKIYSTVLGKERRGDYLGATIQVVPHIIDEIKSFITADLTDEDFVICEIGGTVGDIEGLPFLEAIRQLSNDLGRQNTLFIHLTLVPYIAAAGELKTKPTQHSVKDLLSYGIQPDILLCRTDRPIPPEAKQKLGLFCNVRPERVIEARDIDTIYQVPESYHNEGLDLQVCRYFGLEDRNNPDLTKWHTIVNRIHNPDGQINIAVIGKYVTLLDAYKSLSEALIHAGIANNVKVNFRWLDADNSKSLEDDLLDIHGVLVPGGFGERGVEGKMKAIQIARERKIPFLGICFGMQIAVMEAARNLVGLNQASSTEFGPTPHPVVAMMTEWMDGKTLQMRSQEGDLGGTMRLGSYPCKIQEGSLAHKIYGSTSICERHRHRYEVNMTYRDQLEKAGLHFTGLSPDAQLPEILERTDHPWFVGVQFHPELKSRPFDPHPLFVSFIEAAVQQERLV
jgi:CTP synthase